MSKPRIVCLCGSTRFKGAFYQAHVDKTLAGEIVLTVGIFRQDMDVDNELGFKLDELHRHKIDMADYILIINVDGYIGEGTRREIEYARKLDKPITFLVENVVG